MIKGLKTENFSIDEWEYDKTLVELKMNVNKESLSILFPKSCLIELKELIETCSKYL